VLPVLDNVKLLVEEQLLEVFLLAVLVELGSGAGGILAIG
jgi:hypothetical protein